MSRPQRANIPTRQTGASAVEVLDAILKITDTPQPPDSPEWFPSSAVVGYRAARVLLGPERSSLEAVSDATDLFSGSAEQPAGDLIVDWLMTSNVGKATVSIAVDHVAQHKVDLQLEQHVNAAKQAGDSVLRFHVINHYPRGPHAVEPWTEIKHFLDEK